MASENDQDNDLDAAEPTEGGPSPSEAPASPATPARLAPEARKALSAGERLAAAKAAKASQKAAKAAARKPVEEAAEPEEVVEDEVQARAVAATSWVHDHQATIVKVLGGAALVAAAVLAIQYFSGTSARAAGELMSSALVVAASPTGEAEEGEVLRPGEQRYADEAAREAALVTAYERVVSEQPDSAAAAWARLALGRVKLDAGEFADARTLFEAAIEGAEGGDLTLRAAAIEGVAFSHEGEEHWDEAATQYERLDGLGGAYEQAAAFHQARILLAKGERATAIERLQALIEALRAEDAPDLTYVRDQAELTLMSLDASLVQRTAAPAGLDSLPPELLEQLLRQQGAR